MITEDQIQPESVRDHVNRAIQTLHDVELKGKGWREGVDAEVWDYMTVDDMAHAYRRLGEVMQQVSFARERLFHKIVDHNI